MIFSFNSKLEREDQVPRVSDEDWLYADEPKVDKYCRFPKHKGKHWQEVIEEDRPYVEWLVSGEHDMTLNDDLYDYLMELLEDTP